MFKFADESVEQPVCHGGYVNMRCWLIAQAQCGDGMRGG